MPWRRVAGAECPGLADGGKTGASKVPTPATRTDTSIRVGVGCVASSKTRPRRPGGAGPGGDRPPATGQDGDREERGEPGCGPAGEGGREAGEPLARGGGR